MTLRMRTVVIVALAVMLVSALGGLALGTNYMWQYLSLDGGPSCTHGTNTHFHDSGRTKHVTDFHSSHRHGSQHHHHGELRVTKSGALFSQLYDRQCPKH
jgi:hypothetical protein